MPRPTAAQFAYGALTVVFATLAMLLLSQTRSGPGVAVVAVAGLALGLLVSLTAARTSTDPHHTTSLDDVREVRDPGETPGPRDRTPASLRQ